MATTLPIHVTVASMCSQNREASAQVGTLAVFYGVGVSEGVSPVAGGVVATGTSMVGVAVDG